MRTRYKLALALIVPVTLGAALLVPATIHALDNAEAGDFVTALAGKLGLDPDVVQNAITSVRQERQAAHKAEVEAKIAQAVEEGKLTQRQADIHNALQEIHTANFEKRQDIKEDLRDMTRDERQQYMEKQRATREAEIISALKEKGFEVTSQELEDLREALRELEIGPMKGRGMRGGFRMGIEN